MKLEPTNYKEDIPKVSKALKKFCKDNTHSGKTYDVIFLDYFFVIVNKQNLKKWQAFDSNKKFIYGKCRIYSNPIAFEAIIDIVLTKNASHYKKSKYETFYKKCLALKITINKYPSFPKTPKKELVLEKTPLHSPPQREFTKDINADQKDVLAGNLDAIKFFDAPNIKKLQEIHEVSWGEELAKKVKSISNIATSFGEIQISLNKINAKIDSLSLLTRLDLESVQKQTVRSREIHKRLLEWLSKNVKLINNSSFLQEKKEEIGELNLFLEKIENRWLDEGNIETCNTILTYIEKTTFYLKSRAQIENGEQGPLNDKYLFYSGKLNRIKNTYGEDKLLISLRNKLTVLKRLIDSKKAIEKVIKLEKFLKENQENKHMDKVVKELEKNNPFTAKSKKFPKKK